MSLAPLLKKHTDTNIYYPPFHPFNPLVSHTKSHRFPPSPHTPHFPSSLKNKHKCFSLSELSLLSPQYKHHPFHPSTSDTPVFSFETQKSTRFFYIFSLLFSKTQPLPFPNTDTVLSIHRLPSLPSLAFSSPLLSHFRQRPSPSSSTLNPCPRLSNTDKHALFLNYSFLPKQTPNLLLFLRHTHKRFFSFSSSINLSQNNTLCPCYQK